MYPFHSLNFAFRFHAERAIDIITHILPEDHLLLASSKRVKGETRTLKIFHNSPHLQLRYWNDNIKMALDGSK